MTQPQNLPKPRRNFDTEFEKFMLICATCGSENVSLIILEHERIQAHCFFCDAKESSLSTS